MAINSDLQITLKAIDQTTQAFNSVNANLNGLKSAALKIGAALVGALAIKDVIQSTEDWGVSVRKLQAVTGLTAEQASRLAFVAKTVGIDTDELALSLDRLAKQMFSTSAEADKGKDAFTKWGIAIKDTHGVTRNINDVLVDAATRVKKFGDGAASAALEMDLFGRSGGRLHELLMLGADGVHQLMQESDALGMTLSNQGLSSIIAFQRASNEFGLTMTSLKVTLGNFILPILTNLVHWFISLVERVRDAAMHSQVFAGVIKTLGNAFQAVLGIIKQVVDRIGLFFETLQMKGLGQALQDLVKDVIRKAQEILPKIGAALDAMGPVGFILKIALLSVALGAVVGFAEMFFGPIIGLFRGLAGVALLSGVGAPIALAVVAGLAIGMGVSLLMDQATIQQLAKRWMDPTFWLDVIGLADLGLLAVLALGGSPFLALAVAGALAITWLVTQSYTGSGPQEGDIQQVGGQTWTFHNGEWSLDLLGGLLQSPYTQPAVNPVTGNPNYQPLTGPPNPSTPNPWTTINGTNFSLSDAAIARGGLGMYALGTDYVPKTGLYGLHQGEAVIPADQNRGGSQTVNVYVSGNIATSERELAERIADQVGNVLVRATLANRNLSY